MRRHRFKGIPVVSKRLTSMLSLGSSNVITIFPFVFYKNEYIKMNKTISNHEAIHIQQQIECGVAGLIIFIAGVISFDLFLVFLPAVFLYYILYAVMYVLNLIIYKDDYNAYRNIPFEIEAFNHENQYDYIVFRRWFAWIKDIAARS